ncbi:MAG: 3-phosphoshikimate 1-carboxyvinyltransferase [Bacteroidales bacterium]|jgi:3-phosphoshikimate 1-carboxyvinyltransferase|nr:3-phosphoshikimate 1-carboxyvinyltransferase [Bacteroidales bacterium]
MIISRPDVPLNCVVQLPASKSISNRALLLNALSGSPYPVENLSDSDDTRAMQEVFASDGACFDIGHAGTTMRFLTAYLARKKGVWTLTGSERMKQRPIAVLVEALRNLGADIEYLANDGFPPLKIIGRQLRGGAVSIDGSVSSQYISALLLIAPLMAEGLTLTLQNRITSRSYIELTLGLMRQFGIRYSWTDRQICIPEQEYHPTPLRIEADWSGASYWYEMLALSHSGRVELPGLQYPGLQGDSAIAGWFPQFGITTENRHNSVIISKQTNIQPDFLELDFIENPDMAQTMAALCVFKGIPFLFSGLETLKIKETDRIAALRTELAKFGARLTEPQHGYLAWDGAVSRPKPLIPAIATYHDHRMALSFAPAAMLAPVIIDDPMVVTKSYPAFYEDLKKAGFLCKDAIV